MGAVRATFDGAIVAEPEYFDTANSHGVNFPVYVNRQRKNRDTGSYEDTGDVTKIRVTLWGDLADSTEIQKGDIVEVTATLYEREYQGKNGTGRSLETDWVDSVVVKYRKDAQQAPRPAAKQPVAAGGAANWGDAEPVW